MLLGKKSKVFTKLQNFVNYNNRATIAANEGITILLSAMKNLLLNDTVQYSMVEQHFRNWL